MEFERPLAQESQDSKVGEPMGAVGTRSPVSQYPSSQTHQVKKKGGVYLLYPCASRSHMMGENSGPVAFSIINETNHLQCWANTHVK